MLTDRQNKFYLEIQNIVSNLDEGPERTYLWQAWDDIGEGKDFKKTINQLCINLNELAKYPSGLTEKTENLLNSLIATYGEAKGEFNNSVLSENWRVSNSNPDMIFQGGGWTSRKDLEKQSQRKTGCLGSVISALIFLAFACIFLAVIWTPIVPWIKGHVGNTIFYIGVVVIALGAIFLLLFTGRFRKTRRKKMK